MSKKVTFDQAKKLKELGFIYSDGNDRTYYHKNGELVTYVYWDYYNDCPDDPLDSDIPAPTVSEALDWIREKKHTPCYVDAGYCHKYDTVGYWGVILSDFGCIKRVQTETSPTHPLAESALLDAVLTYLEQKEKK